MQGIIAQLFALAVRLTRVYQHRRRTVRRNWGADETLSRVHFFTANNSFGLFLFWTSHVLFFCSTRFKVSRMLMFRAREVGLLATASKSKQALVPKVYLPRGEKGNVYSSSSDGIYLVLSSSSDDFRNHFLMVRRKFLPVCLSLVGTFICRFVAPSSPITLIPFPITITNPIRSDPMAGLFQKVWNHTRKDSKSIYGRSSLDAGHRSLHKRPLQYIDEGNFARISSSPSSPLTMTKKKKRLARN